MTETIAGEATRERSERRALCPVVLAADGGYVMQLATTMRSVVDANPHGWPVEFEVLAHGIGPDARRRIADSLPPGAASIRWRPVALGGYAGYATSEHVSAMTFARFMIPDVVEPTVRRVLYLDSDLLVLDDLRPLCEVDLEGAAVGAVVDGLDAQLDDPGRGLPRVQRYFNAGVLVIDLVRWRAERVSERAVEYLARYPQTPFADQDALNVACDGRWKALDERWNFQVVQYDGRDLVENDLSTVAATVRPAVTHFVTHLKPWAAASLSVNDAFYDAFRRRTRFARTRREQLVHPLARAWYACKRWLRRYPWARAAWTALGGRRGRAGR